MKKLILTLTLVLTLNLLVGAAVDAAENEETFTLDEVVVTASKYEEQLSETSVSMEVVDEEEINQSSAVNVANLLKDINSVQINDKGSLAGQKTISIRGSDPSQVLVLLDGQELNSRQNGQIDLSTIPTAQIKKIEVLKGPASAIYGANALGGVVNIITKDAVPEQKTTIELAAGSFSTIEYTLTQSGGGEDLAYNLAVSDKSSDGHRDNPDNDDLEQTNLFTKFKYEIDQFSDLTLTVNHNDTERGVPGPTNMPTPNAQQVDESTNLSLQWLQQKESSDSKVIVAHKQQDQTFDNPDQWSYTGPSKHETKQHSLKYQQTYYLENNTFNYGIEVEENKIDSTANGEHENFNQAVFVTDEWNISGPLKFNLGGRYDEHEMFGGEFSPRLGAVYNVNQKFNFHLSASKAYRTPTFNDLYWPEDTYTAGNPDLEPETAKAYEVGARYHTSQTKLKANYFIRKADNLIDWAQDDNTGQWKPYNLSEAQISGIEMSLQQYLFDNTTADFNYTYLDAQNEQTDSRIKYKPYHTANFALKYNPESLTAKVNGKLVAGRTGNSASYFVVDTKLSKDLKVAQRKMKVSLKVNNLLDREYQVVNNYPMPERNYGISCKVKF